MVKFEICPNCGLHGSIVLNGVPWVEVISQEHLAEAMLWLQARQIVTPNETVQVFIQAQLAELPETDADHYEKTFELLIGTSPVAVMALVTEIGSLRPSEIARRAGAFPG